jgi:hypothetical protein
MGNEAFDLNALNIDMLTQELDQNILGDTAADFGGFSKL